MGFQTCAVLFMIFNTPLWIISWPLGAAKSIRQAPLQRVRAAMT